MGSEPRSARSYFLFYMILSFDDSSSFLGSEIVPGGTGLTPLTDSTTIDGTSTVESHSTNYKLPLDKDTRISRTVSFVPTESSYIFSFKRKRVKRTLWHAPSVSVHCTYRTLKVIKIK